MEAKTNVPWTRKHDNPNSVHLPSVPRILYPSRNPDDNTDILRDLIGLCRTHDPDQRLHAAGSHWALNESAQSDHSFIETNDPNSVYQAMSATLTGVVPDALSYAYLQKMAHDESLTYLVHVESGKRIYQLYAELDQPVNTDDQSTLAGVLKHRFGAPQFGGPHGFNTLGSAGGQTVVGALTTGTHGGDFDRPPVADSVAAMHLVTDGGKHYWIEPNEFPRMTEDSRLKTKYATDELGGENNFEIIRDDDVFNAVLVGAGRFGIIYSVVLKARPQYLLHEQRRLSFWDDVKKDLANHDSNLYKAPANNHFLQVAVCLTPRNFFHSNRVGVTKRWSLRVPGLDPAGRKERVGRITNPFDPRIQGPVFEHAGTTHGYSPPGDLGGPPTPSFLEIACSNANWTSGFLDGIATEIENFVNDHGRVTYPGMTAVAIGVPGGAGLIALIAGFIGVLRILHDILDAIDPGDRFGQVMNALKNNLLDPLIPDPVLKKAGLITWQMIANQGFESQQKNRDMEAISYAVMDSHDYLNISCDVNVDSVEVFFDSVDDRLVGYIDALIDFERQQEYQGKATVGYASIRMTQGTRALLGVQKHPITAAVEVSCLRDVTGGTDLVAHATTLARSGNFGALLHWGQRNEYTVDEVEARYGDAPDDFPRELGKWRAVLSRLTDNGRLDGFSNDFTRQRGLEVVQPKVRWVKTNYQQAFFGSHIKVEWDATNNPAGTTARLEVQSANGTELRSFPGLDLAGSLDYQIQDLTTHKFILHTTYVYNHRFRRGEGSATVHVS